MLLKERMTRNPIFIRPDTTVATTRGVHGMTSFLAAPSPVVRSVDDVRAS